MISSIAVIAVAVVSAAALPRPDTAENGPYMDERNLDRIDEVPVKNTRYDIRGPLDKIAGSHLLRDFPEIEDISFDRDSIILRLNSNYKNNKGLENDVYVDFDERRSLDKIGGGTLLRSDDYPRTLSKIGGGHLIRSLEKLGGGHLIRGIENSLTYDQKTGGNLIRDLESALRENPVMYERPSRNLDSLEGITFGASKRFDSLSGQTFGANKRNMDEIDRSGFDTFIKKSYDFGPRGRIARRRDFEPSAYENYANFHPRPIPLHHF